MPREEEESLLPREPPVRGAEGMHHVPAHTSDRQHHEDQQEEAPSMPLSPRERRSLVFLQMNSPLSVLFCIVSGIVGVMIVPSISDVFTSHPTLYTAAPRLFLGYLFVLFLFQVGFCVLAVISQNSHTQRCIIQSTGSRLAVENYMMAVWFILFVLDTPLTTTLGCYVLAGIGVLSLVNFVVLRAKYRPRWVHPFELFLVHIPNKLMTVLVIYHLFWQQLFLDNGWVRDPWRGYDHLSNSLVYAIVVQVVFGILLAAWVGMNSDLSVYVASMYLDSAVLGLKAIPMLGPRSRPFSMTLIMIISMAVRTVCFFVPVLVRNRYLIVCHAHRGERAAHAQADVPPSREQDELQAAYARQQNRPADLEGVTVHRPNGYGATANHPSS
ncbi:hypothetical protein MYAM1_002322 [Malassezia yamatoensis]|uniref:Uncharacterized protein n=1 Tax=Malassezia yamatoensis TaxID=253288 RepID=A0AAJ5YXS9_9BASI|nr:hypothetical protein MYAM1_002322 [Malassezia yamatoensis]